MQEQAYKKFLEHNRRAQTNNAFAFTSASDLIERRKEALKRRIQLQPQDVKEKPELIKDDQEDKQNSAIDIPPENFIDPIEPGPQTLFDKYLDFATADEYLEKPAETPGIFEAELFSKDEIIIRTSFFANMTLKNIIQEAAGIYCVEANGWIVPIQLYCDLKQKLKAMNIRVLEIPDFVVKALSYVIPIPSAKLPHNYRAERMRTMADVPESIKSRLYPFQSEGIQFALEHHGRVLIGDEMGVGKTIQGIGIASAYQDEWPCLIICPACVKLNWRNEFMHWLPELEARDFYLLESKRSMNNSAKVWFTSYHMATLLEPFLTTKIFNVVIVDESHFLKNYNAKRTKFIVPILHRAKRVILLSGTPVLSKPAEIFTQLSALRPDIFSSFRAFAERYCDPQVRYNYVDYSGAARIKELNTILTNTVMIRRLKADVLSQLPPKNRQKVEIAVNVALCRQVKKLLVESKAQDAKKKELFGVFHTQDQRFDSGDFYITKAYKLTGQAKLKGIVEYVQYLIQSDCKFIIFAHHLEVLDEIEKVCNREKTNYIRIDGSTNNERRQKGVEAFQKIPACKVAILGILAAGQGITLTAASTVVMAELVWTPGVLVQAEDRAHRIGQERSVNIHYLYGPGTLDEQIWPKIQRKLSIITGALDDNQNFALQDLLRAEQKLGMGNFESEDGRSDPKLLEKVRMEAEKRNRKRLKIGEQ